MRLNGKLVVVVLFGLLAVPCGTAVASAAEAEAARLEGKWRYQSYRPDPVSLGVGQDPKFVPFSPPGEVTIDAGEKTGTLVFPSTRTDSTPPLTLKLTILVEDHEPKRVSISASAPRGITFTNELQGWLVPADPSEPAGDGNPLVVWGAIVQTSKGVGMAAQPENTTGFFVLERQR